MALILSACVLQDTMSSESPQGSLQVFYLMEKRKRGGGMFDRASPRHSPLLPSVWASPCKGQPCRESGILGWATPSVHTSVFWPSDFFHGFLMVQKTSQKPKVPL